MGTRSSLLVCLLLLAPGAGFAHAPSTSGAARVGPAPTSLVPGETQSADRIVVFVERENVALERALTLDRGAGDGAPVELEAGTRVNAIYVHFNPTEGGGELEGTITFDEEVLGVATGDSLWESDAHFQRSGTTYPVRESTEAAGRSVEATQDEVTFEPPHTVRVRLREDGAGADQLRILTRAEGESDGGCHCAAGPGALSPFALAVGMLLMRRRRGGGAC